jgi:hypothetical protein
MHCHSRLFLCLAAVCVAWASPIDFGKLEFASALAERKLPSNRFRVMTEVSTEAPESFRIVGARISGGDIRGIMYGLLEAAEQIRSTGRLVQAKGAAAMRVRGVRIPLTAGDLEKDWFHARAHWEALLATFARSRLNRLNLAFDERAAFSGRVLDALRLISEIASAYAVDLVVSVHPETVTSAGLDLRVLLAGCPAIRSVQVTGVAAGRLELVRAVSEAGRRVTVEIPHQDLTPGVLGEVADTGVPWLVSALHKGQSPPAVAGAEALIWRLEAPGAVKRAEWSDPAFVRRTLQEMAQPGVAGFEIEAPQAASLDANRLLYLLWGRLSYDTKAPETLWGGKAAKKK